MSTAAIPGPLVWARKHVAITTCPKSYVTAESVGLVEEFFIRRRLGATGTAELTARQVEAFVILEKELAGEKSRGQQSTRQAV
jgi:hypothetical protein